jgi:hypothetical protein
MPHRRVLLLAALGVTSGVAMAMAVTLKARQADVLQSVGGVPAHLAGLFEEPLAYQQLASGQSVVFDRRAHAVYAIDAGNRSAVRIIDIGPEQGRLLGPRAFDASGEMIVVADAPNLVERIQFFNEKGQRIGGFSLPGKAAARVTVGTLVLSGVSSLQFTGRSLLVAQPETGALVTEYGLAGTPVRTFGALRTTGYEDDRDVHLALNVGLPLANPRGGYYFVFLTGEPRFRRYAPDGTLVLERLMQGREIDDLVRAQPTRWPRRDIGGQVLPLVPPVVRTAAVDPDGRLWVSFVVPYTYVFDEDGDKVRAVQFRGAGVIAPTSLHFASRARLLVTPGLFEFDPR